MSPLAFDKQGKPFSWHSRTAKLRVRLFRNPAARGTCCQVLDAGGLPLYVDAETDYAEFRRAIGNVPGFYRLDQCDEDALEIEGAPPAYVSIEHLRNAGPNDGNGTTTDVSPLAIIERLVAIQADVMKTMATQQAAIMAASAEIMRAPYRPAPPAPIGEPRNASADELEDDQEDDDDCDEAEDAPKVESPLISVARMVDATVPNIAAQLGEFLYEKAVELMRQRKAGTAPAMTMPPMPVTAQAVATPATPPAEPQVDVAAGADTAHAVSTGVVSSEVPTEANTPIEDQPRNAAPTDVMPTPAQFAHLQAVRARLSTKERAIAEAAIARMDGPLLMQWLGEITALSVEDAVVTIRTLIAQLRPDSK